MFFATKSEIFRMEGMQCRYETVYDRQCNVYGASCVAPFCCVTRQDDPPCEQEVCEFTSSDARNWCGQTSSPPALQFLGDAGDAGVAGEAGDVALGQVYETVITR